MPLEQERLFPKCDQLQGNSRNGMEMGKGTVPALAVLNSREEGVDTT